MTLMIKESLELNSQGKPGSPAPNSESKSGESPRSSPVCLEVPITIRSMPGENGNASEASGPTREEGRTVIVFDNGAVLRLSTNLPAGQAVILSNSQGRDVVCRIVKGRNLQTVKGYIEVEFVEPVNDFWRIHQTAEPAAVSPPPTPVLASPQPLSVVTPPAASVAPRVVAPARETNFPSDSAPTFEDIAGLVRMSPPAAARVKIQEPAPQTGALKSRDELAHGQVVSAKSASEISAPSPIAAAPLEKPSIPAAGGSSSLPVQKPAPSNDFMAIGALAPGQSSSVSFPVDSRGRMQLIVGGAALILAGFGAGYFFMHRGSAPSPAAPVAVAAQLSTPSSPVASSAAKPVQTLPPAVKQAPTQNQLVSTVASVTPEMGGMTPSEAQDSRQPTSSTVAKQPNPAATRRQAISNLKMSSPTAPRQNLAKLSEGPAPTVPDVASAVALGGAPASSMLSPVVRMENQPAPPPSLGSSGSSSRVTRDPKLISSTRPEYPLLAKQTSIQGRVVVSAEVAANGNVTGVKAISGPMLLREAAIDAVKQWKYAPELIDGKPVAAQVTIGVEFRLN